MIQVMRQCTSYKNPVRDGSYEVFGLGDERVWPSCTCPAFTFRRHGVTNFGGRTVAVPCKHIAAAEAQACLWHELDGTHSIDPASPDTCPKCGADTELVRVAV
jgi:hypothetical protein